MLTPNVPTRSSFCRWDEPQCLEVTRRRGVRGRVELRDTKLGTASPVQVFTRHEWRQFVRRITRYVWLPAADGLYRVGDLAFTRAEVDAFREGARAGEFAV